MFYPAGLRGVVSVGAVDRTDAVADFSTFNRAVDLSAPGVDTLSTVPAAERPVRLRSGSAGRAWPRRTSPASRRSSGPPGRRSTSAELEGVLRASAVDLGDPGRDDHYGSGLVDAAAALAAAGPVAAARLRSGPGPDRCRSTSPSPRRSSRSARPRPDDPVAWTVSHAIVDGVLVRLSWPLVHGGACPEPTTTSSTTRILPFDSPTAGHRAPARVLLPLGGARVRRERGVRRRGQRVGHDRRPRPAGDPVAHPARRRGPRVAQGLTADRSSPSRSAGCRRRRSGCKNLSTGRWVNGPGHLRPGDVTRDDRPATVDDSGRALRDLRVGGDPRRIGQPAPRHALVVHRPALIQSDQSAATADANRARRRPRHRPVRRTGALAAEVAVDRRRGSLAVAHRQDDRRRAADDVAAGEHPVDARHPGLVDLDVARARSP